MEYLLQDLIKLPLSERLSIIERAISSFVQKDSAQEIMKRIISNYKEELIENGVQAEKANKSYCFKNRIEVRRFTI